MNRWGRAGVALGIVLAGGAGLVLWWQQADRVVSPVDAPRGDYGFSDVVPLLGTDARWGRSMILQAVAGAAGYAVEVDEAGESYRLAMNEFRLGPEGVGEGGGEEEWRERIPGWPREETSVRGGVPAYLELIFRCEGEAGERPERFLLRDAATGWELDPEGDAVWVGDRWLRLSFSPLALHDWGALVEIYGGGGGETLRFFLPEVPGMPEANRGVKDLFAVEVPFFVGEPHDLLRLVLGLAQLRSEPDFVLIPQQMERAGYESRTVKELWREYLSHDAEGGVWVDSAELLVRRRSGQPDLASWRERWRRLWP